MNKKIIVYVIAALAVAAVGITAYFMSTGEKDTITVYVDQLPDNLLPVYAQNTVASYLNDLLYTGLTAPSGYDAGRIENQAAVDIEQDAKDKALYTVTVNSEYFWPDGRLLSVDDVIYTLDLILEPQNNSPYRGKYSDILAGYERTGDNTMTVRFSIPVAYEDAIWILKFKILPKFVDGAEMPVKLRTYEGYQELRNNPVGSGPFRITERYSNELVLSRKDPNHPIKTIHFVLYTDPVTTVRKMDNRNLSVMLDVDPGYYDVLDEKGLNSSEYVPVGFNALVFNCEDPLLSDPVLRKALSIGIDRESVVDGLYGPDGEDYIMLNTFPMNETEQAYKSLEKYQGYDLDKAREILGTIEPRPNTLELMINNKMGRMAEEIAEAVVRDYAGLGITVTVADLNSENFLTRLKNGRFQAALHYFNNFSYKYDYFSIYHSYSEFSYSRLKDPDLDDTVMKFRNSVIVDEKMVYAQKMNDILRDRNPYVYLTTGARRAYYSNKLTGVYLVNPSALLGSLPEWSYVK